MLAFNMLRALSGGPIHVSGGWMDSGPAYYFSVASPWLILALVVYLLITLLETRSPRLIGLFLTGVVLAHVLGLYLELFGWGLILFYLVASVISVKKVKPEDRNRRLAVLGSGCLAIGISIVLGFPQTVIMSPVSCRSNLKNIGTACEMYFTDNNAYPTSLEQLTPMYLKTVPSCIPGEVNSYELRNVSSQNYEVYCVSPGHKHLGEKDEEKRHYTGAEGLVQGGPSQE